MASTRSPLAAGAMASAIDVTGSRIDRRSVLGLISVFDIGPSVEADDGLVFFEANASSRERDISVRQRMQHPLHGSNCVHEWRDAVDDDAEAELFQFGRPH